MSPSFTIYEAGTSLDWDDDTSIFLNVDNKNIVLGVRNHTGKYYIEGNKKADSAAKSALELPHAKVGVFYTNFKHCISLYILSTWQDDWNDTGVGSGGGGGGGGGVKGCMCPPPF